MVHSIRSSSALRRASTSRRTKSGENRAGKAAGVRGDSEALGKKGKPSEMVLAGKRSYCGGFGGGGGGAGGVGARLSHPEISKFQDVNRKKN
jgi:hypothetical protein